MTDGIIHDNREKLTETEILALNRIRESLSTMLSSAVAELEHYKGIIDRKQVLQYILIELLDAKVPPTKSMHMLSEIKQDLIRQVKEYIEREK